MHAEETLYQKLALIHVTKIVRSHLTMNRTIGLRD